MHSLLPPPHTPREAHTEEAPPNPPPHQAPLRGAGGPPSHAPPAPPTANGSPPPSAGAGKGEGNRRGAWPPRTAGCYWRSAAGEAGRGGGGGARAPRLGAGGGERRGWSGAAGEGRRGRGGGGAPVSLPVLPLQLQCPGSGRATGSVGGGQRPAAGAARGPRFVSARGMGAAGRGRGTVGGHRGNREGTGGDRGEGTEPPRHPPAAHSAVTGGRPRPGFIPGFPPVNREQHREPPPPVRACCGAAPGSERPYEGKELRAGGLGVLPAGAGRALLVSALASCTEAAGAPVGGLRCRRSGPGAAPVVSRCVSVAGSWRRWHRCGTKALPWGHCAEPLVGSRRPAAGAVPRLQPSRGCFGWGPPAESREKRSHKLAACMETQRGAGQASSTLTLIFVEPFWGLHAGDLPKTEIWLETI